MSVRLSSTMGRTMVPANEAVCTFSVTVLTLNFFCPRIIVFLLTKTVVITLCVDSW